MVKIITNSQLQRDVSKISKTLKNSKKPFIVTTHGQPKMFIVPYFEDGDEILDEYFENYEMWKNKKKLQERYEKSSQSGESNLRV